MGPIAYPEAFQGEFRQGTERPASAPGDPKNLIQFALA
jgi:hypothetical protein